MIQMRIFDVRYKTNFFKTDVKVEKESLIMNKV